MINQKYLANMNITNDKKFIDFIHQIPIQLTKIIHGNHLFFIGEKGACETADDIDLLIKNVATIKIKMRKYA